MLLTLTNRTPPAHELSFLLHKHPDKVQTFSVAFGQAHVFYPEVSEGCCTVCLCMEIDPIALVRGSSRGRREGPSLDQYVNDRPYVASSFLSVAIAQVFGTALAGRCKDREQLVTEPLDLEATLEVVPARGGEGMIHQLFEPLGYEVETTRHPLDPRFPEWGESPYHSVRLRGKKRLKELLVHLYVLVPVLDNDKHYWVGEDEIEKLLDKGEGWLREHPAREMITRRYLRHQRTLTRDALARLTADEHADPDAEAQVLDRQEEGIERPLSLNEQRHAAVVAAAKSRGGSRVLDLGCAQGRLLRRLVEESQFQLVVGLDVSLRALEMAEERLKMDRWPEAKRQRVKLLHGSLLYRDARISGFDVACLVEVIEHLDPPRLAAMERTVFEFARPSTVVVTTPNVEYNVRFDSLPAGKLRHGDHRFEWTRSEFETWARGVAERFSYQVRFASIGDRDVEVGSPTQMGVFER